MIALNNKNEFVQAIQGNTPVLVDFWAPWCVYCRRLEPTLEVFAQQHPELTVVKVNIDEVPEVAIQERIEVIPTLVLYQNGNALGSIVAPESKAMIDNWYAEGVKGV